MISERIPFIVFRMPAHGPLQMSRRFRQADRTIEFPLVQGADMASP